MCEIPWQTPLNNEYALKKMKGRNLIPVLFMVGTSGRGKGEYG
jgi:hypothetical protein